MNKSISEEWEKLFEGHCICDKYAPQEDIGCIIHGEDGIKAKKFIQSKISQALTAERKEFRKKLIGRYTRIKSRLEDAVGKNDYKMRGQIEMIDDLLCYLDEISLLEEK